MKLTSLIAVSTALVFSGCFGKKCPEPEVITKIEYIKPVIPTLQPKPNAEKYTVKLMKIDNNDLYVIDKHSASIMSSNWESYKIWAETNFNILKSLKKD